MGKRTTGAIAAVGSIAALLQWIETSVWLPNAARTMMEFMAPYLGKIASTTFLALACIGLWRILHIERRLEILESKLDKQSPDQIQLGEDELLHLNMLWKWDRNRHEVIGPLCPDHKTSLAYQPSVGLPPIYADFEDKHLSASGWFFCPRDNKTFTTAIGGLVKDLRWDVENRFRTIFKLPPKAKRPPTPKELELQRQVKEKLFGQAASEDQCKQ